MSHKVFKTTFNLLEADAICMLLSVCTKPLLPDLKMVDEENVILANSLALTAFPIPTGKVLMPYFRSKAEGALTESDDGPLMMRNNMLGFPGGASPKLFNCSNVMDDIFIIRTCAHNKSTLKYYNLYSLFKN